MTVYPKFFDPLWYSEVYPDVAASGMAPLRHYLRYGRYEGRRACALLAADRERDFLLGLIEPQQIELLLTSPTAAERVWARLALARQALRGAALPGLPQTLAAAGRDPRAKRDADLGTAQSATGADAGPDAGLATGWPRAQELLAPLTLEDLAGFALLGPVLLAAEAALVCGAPARAAELLDGARRWFGWSPMAQLRGHSDWRDLALARANLAPSRARWRRRLLWPYLSAGYLPPRLLAAPRPVAAGAPSGEAGGSLGAAPALPAAPPKAAFDRLAAPWVWPRRSGPLVSVLMPARNAEATIDTALWGLRQQSWKQLEILVINNGSQDGTAARVAAQAAQDRRIRLLDGAAAAGAYGARNLGLAAARGAFITTHDADDWAHPARISGQIRALLRAPKLMATLSQFVRASSDLRLTRWWGGDRLSHPNMSSLMFRSQLRDELGYWDQVRGGADSEYLARIRAVYGADAVHEIAPGLPLSFGRQSENSLSQASATSVQSLWHGARRAYSLAAAAWHRETLAAGKPLYLPQVPSIRPFAAPPALLVEPEGSPGPCRAAPTAPSPAVSPAQPPASQALQSMSQPPLGPVSGLASDLAFGLAAASGAETAASGSAAVSAAFAFGKASGRGPVASAALQAPPPSAALSAELAPGPNAIGAWQRLMRAPLFAADWCRQAAPSVRILGQDPAERFLAALADLPPEPETATATETAETAPEIGTEPKTENKTAWHDAVLALPDPGPRFSVSGYALEAVPGAFRAAGEGGADPSWAGALLARLQDPSPCLPDLAGALPDRAVPRVLVFAHRAGAQVFGAERSFLDMLERVSAAGLLPLAVLPSAGSQAYRAAVLARCHRLFIRPYFWRYGGMAPPPATVELLAELIENSASAEVHINTSVLDAPLAAAQKAGVPATIWVRELAASDPQLCRDLSLSPEALRAALLDSGARLIANSAPVASWLKGRGPEEAPPEALITILPNPIDPALFLLPPPDLAVAVAKAATSGPPPKADFSLAAAPAQSEPDPPDPPDPPEAEPELQPQPQLRRRARIGLIGSLTARKGLIEIVALARVLPQADFLLIGPESAELTALRRARRLPLNVISMGYIADPAAALTELDLVLSLSRVAESYGRTVAEALAAARPVICWDHGAPPDLVGRDGAAGRVVALRDLPELRRAVLDMLQPARFAKASAAARARAKVLAAENAAVPDAALFPAAVARLGA